MGNVPRKGGSCLLCATNGILENQFRVIYLARILLLGRGRQGKKREEALADLYEKEYDRLARYIFVRIGNQLEAEDLASETFVRALQNLDRYEERGLPMKAWVFKIAHNLVVDHIRKVSKRPTVPLDDIVLSGGNDPEEIAEHNFQIERLSKALEHLSPAQREIIALRFFAGLSSVECAEILGKKSGAIREMQRAAVSTLRTIMNR